MLTKLVISLLIVPSTVELMELKVCTSCVTLTKGTPLFLLRTSGNLHSFICSLGTVNGTCLLGPLGGAGEPMSAEN